MDAPAKRPKLPPAMDQDYVSFGADAEDADFETRYANGDEPTVSPTAPSGPRMDRRPDHGRPDPRLDRRHALDRPKSKHALPGHEPWVLVKTKYGRRFVHNPTSRESLWHVPDALWPAVKDFDANDKARKEKEANVKWAEAELAKMREGSKAEVVNAKADAEEMSGQSSRRRRSESLQREDEEAMMAELAAQAEHAEEQDVEEAVKTLEPIAGEVGYDSEGSYEYVEVTDDEEQEGQEVDAEGDGGVDVEQADAEDGPVEFGEDDIAYQLAAMGEEYGLDPEEYGDAAPEEDEEQGWDEPDEGLAISDEDAANLFRDLLDDHGISPLHALGQTHRRRDASQHPA